MASTFANRATAWRIRSDGDELNGGGFDAFVSGAGTDYSDQASPQISSTTGTCTVGSTTWSDTGVTFTSAMVGNVLRVSAKAGGSAIALDYFVITGYIDANNITLDRTPCAGANITAATYRIGGAHASMQSYASAATGSFSTPTLATPLLAGNQIYIRGDGNADPSTVSFDWSGGTWTIPSGSRADGMVSLIGYNGRPLIQHDCALLFEHGSIRHLSIKRKTGANPTFWFIRSASYVRSRISATDCIFDQAGYDSTEFDSSGGSFTFNEVRNSGGGSVGTKNVVQLSHPCNHAIGNYFHGLRGPALTSGDVDVTTLPTFCYNTIVNCLSDGIVAYHRASSYSYAIFNNTINGNGGNGITLGSGFFGNSSVFNNIISNHTGSGKYAVYSPDSYTTNRRIRRSVIDFNCYYGNTNNFNQVSSADVWVLQANDITTDPGYVNAAAGNYATGANVRDKGLSGLGGLNGTLGAVVNKVNIGAYQNHPSSMISIWNSLGISVLKTANGGVVASVKSKDGVANT